MPLWVEWVRFVVEIVTLILVAIYVHKTWQIATSTQAAADATARAAEESTRARMDALAPRVVAYFQYETHIATIVIENVGAGTASDVSFRFDPPLTSSQPRLVPKFFQRVTPVLAPGQKIANVFDGWPQYFASKLPLQYKLHLSYHGVENRQKYSSVLVLDAEPLGGILSTGRKDLHDAVQEIERSGTKIEKALKELVAIGEARGEAELYPPASADFSETLTSIGVLWSISAAGGESWTEAPGQRGMCAALQTRAIRAVLLATAEGQPAERVERVRRLCAVLHDYRQGTLGDNGWKADVETALRALDVAIPATPEPGESQG